MGDSANLRCARRRSRTWLLIVACEPLFVRLDRQDEIQRSARVGVTGSARMTPITFRGEMRGEVSLIRIVGCVKEARARSLLSKTIG